MIAAELYKVRHLRTPLVLTAGGALILLAGPIYLALRAPDNATAYADTLREVFDIVTILSGTILGGWILGQEYRQGTLRRVLAIDPRRATLLGAKAAVMLGTFVIVTSAALGVGLAGTAASAAINNDSLPTSTLARDIGASTIFGVMTLGIAYTLSALLRSDAYAMLASFAVLIVTGTLLADLPGIGPYLPGSAAIDLGAWVRDEPATQAGRAALVAVIWLVALGAVAQQAFARRDV